MDSDGSFQLARTLIILTIGWFSVDISKIQKPLKIKLFYSLLLSAVVFSAYSIWLKNLSFIMFLIIFTMSSFLVSMKHFLDHHAEKYGQMDVLAFLKKKNSNKNKKDMY